jgi:4-hydroxybenzoate polyprenyltransferase
VDQCTPLCVDLDGTLIRSDLLVEGLLWYLKQNAIYALLAVFWLIRGKGHLKAEIGRRASLNVGLLPVNGRFLEWLRAEHRQGRRLVLCTAANCDAATRVAAHFGLFERTICSSLARSLRGRTRAAVLVEQYGVGGFDYAGNEQDDVHVWATARRAIIVSPTLGLRLRMASVARIEETFLREAGSSISRWVRALRLHQWTKNLLIFVPALASHRALEPAVAQASLLAFLWFSLCASATYLLNDLLDLEADRAHPTKRLRPLASGDMSLVTGIVTAALLLGISVVGAVLSSSLIFVALLLMYLAGTLWYSFMLKRIAMVDALSLAGLYTVRVIAGGAAVSVAPSFWLLAFSMFMFLSLAMVKRYTELRSVLTAGDHAAAGRGYVTDDLPLLLSCGTASGFVSVMVLALYVNLGAGELYRYPEALWLICPAVLYWICRVWRKAHRGELHDDPVVFAIKDKPSLVVGGLCAMLVWAAS